MTSPEFTALRPYQAKALAAVETKFRAGAKSALLVLPTGAGKTICFAELAKRTLPRRSLILAHRGELIHQARDKVAAVTGIIPGIEMAGERASSSDNIVIASVQTLARGRKIAGAPFDLTIIDEAHHALAASYRGIIECIAPRCLLGVTATPYRTDNQALGALFSETAFQLSMLDLIRQGYLSDVKVRTLPVDIPLTDVRLHCGDFSENGLGDALAPYLDEIAGLMASEYANRKTLAFCPLVNTSKMLVQALKRHGLPAEHVDGSSPDRADILARFAAGETHYLSNANLLVEGYDEPSIDTLLMLRPTRSRGLFSQMIGRGTRLYPGKECLLVIDPLFQCERHNVIGVHDIVSEDDAQSQRVRQIMHDQDVGLCEGIEIEAEERQSNLAKALHSHSRRPAYNMFLADLAICLDDSSVRYAVPATGWQAEGPTSKQVAILDRAGITILPEMTRGLASRIISIMMRRQAEGLCTWKQSRMLRKLGYPNPEQLSVVAASAAISEAIGGKKVAA